MTLLNFFLLLLVAFFAVGFPIVLRLFFDGISAVRSVKQKSKSEDRKLQGEMMPDITMCPGITLQDRICPKIHSCYRARAIPNPYRQSYFGELPINFDTGVCEYYDKIRKGDRLQPEVQQSHG